MNTQLFRPDSDSIRNAMERLRIRRGRRRSLWITLAVCAVLIAAALLTVAYPVRMEGFAMQPALTDGQIVLVNRLHARADRGDLALFEHGGSRVIRRVVAVGGDRVDCDPLTGAVTVNGEPLSDTERLAGTGNVDLPKDYTVPYGSLFVLGDNLVEAEDSRYSAFGTISTEDVTGTVWFVLNPPHALK